MNWVIWILLSFIMGIIANVCSSIISKSGKKQFEKYNKENSSLVCDTVEMFVSKVRNLSGVKVCDIEPGTNKVPLIYQGNKYTITIKDGIAFVEYDVIELSISKIGKIISLCRAPQIVKKAMIINSLMDSVLGKTNPEQEEESKKLKNSTGILAVSVLGMVVFLIIGIVGAFGNYNEQAILNVKDDMYFYDTYASSTYGELIDGYLTGAEWEAFVSENQVVVEVDGTSIEGDQVCIQFIGDSGMGYNSVESQDFDLYYFDINGESVDPEAAMGYIYEYLYY